MDAHTKKRIVRVAADAGYDAERAHVFARETLGIEAMIPNRVGGPTKKTTNRKVSTDHGTAIRCRTLWASVDDRNS